MPDRTNKAAWVAAAIAVLCLFAVPAVAQDRAEWSLALHGGAGVIERGQLSPEQDAAYRAALNNALAVGARVLADGGSALDAVEAVIQVLEDDPLFNAGRGAVFTADGRIEHDAAIMDGTTLNAGAVAGLTRTRHPISAARAVMEKSPHVFLIGAGAETFARDQGLEEVDPSYFFTERRWQGLVRQLERDGLPVPARPEGAPEPGAMAQVAPALDEKKFGTVGVVALDREGRLAAGTSTGGMSGKRWGRVGDVPVIGAGTYASNAEGCAVSATGSGEYFIRATVARDICARYAMETGYPQLEADRVEAVLAACEAGAPPGSFCTAHARRPVYIAASAEIREVGELGGEGGVIVMTRSGEPWFEMNTSGMYRGAVSSDQPAWVAIYADEDR
ncbi:MAG: isoaspartyl peptidase/L-asparaginase [Alphaproteobacteria bacterium]|nr:isoaspartyl peptidase/L-asparaginase [Alphaproteobacteria bacterium]MBU1525934.1 isoaspartyl peptidase/L-asparaginase [Alphaproteobacteria bacterium]MBU2116190.1 isoaspartyl peptidase/L-asparaginase [Alphaproteobacteria bacterium]MBU2351617.1 isoaspartyl peptidase/L-asparaginase [Alphaproteobacteria bacterium]MBU2383788.1 isoaspartyl peptidase/L-asparaginase [Alphaproteobacteria bacterium]